MSDPQDRPRFVLSRLPGLRAIEAQSAVIATKRDAWRKAAENIIAARRYDSINANPK
jgi:hypothetical protein